MYSETKLLYIKKFAHKLSLYYIYIHHTLDQYRQLHPVKNKLFFAAINYAEKAIDIN